MPPVEILPYLWLGDRKDAEESMQQCMDLVVNCTKDIPFLAPHLNNIRIAVDDIPEHNAPMLAAWTQTDTLQIIQSHLNCRRNVLVHCHMGRQRSAATIAALLMKEQSMTRDEAIMHIKSKKREAFFPNVNFEEALRMFGDSLRGSESGCAGAEL